MKKKAFISFALLFRILTRVVIPQKYDRKEKVRVTDSSGEKRLKQYCTEGDKIRASAADGTLSKYG